MSSLVTSQEAQLRAPLSSCNQPGPVLTLICIAVGHPQQAPLCWRVATAVATLHQAICRERVELLIEFLGRWLENSLRHHHWHTFQWILDYFCCSVTHGRQSHFVLCTLQCDVIVAPPTISVSKYGFMNVHCQWTISTETTSDTSK